MALNILYGWHIDERLGRLLNGDKEHDTHLSNIRLVLRAWLQAPVRLSAVPEAIDTLVLNKRWWNDAADSLSNTQMRPDFQFLFPTTIAAAVWLWTLVAAFIEDPLPGQAASGTNLEWQISSGAISLFLVRVHPFPDMTPFSFISYARTTFRQTPWAASVCVFCILYV